MSLTHERLREVLNYDPMTGVFVWKKRLNNRALVGHICRNFDHRGYLRINIDRKIYRAARLAWLYIHGKWPPHEIDHINGIPGDDRLDNLREATHSENCNNRPPRKSGRLKGVYFNKRDNGWCARITGSKRTHFLGRFATEAEAHAAYAKAAPIIHGEFARIK
jgi:hypothetical protein